MNEPSETTSPWRAFGVLAIAVFLAILDLFIVNIAFPDIRRSFPTASLSELSSRSAPSATSAVLLVLFTLRSARHPAPVVELPLL